MQKGIIYPVDSANFKWIRENGMIYVDKTGFIHKLTCNKGKYYFLARPRRFGKSLFLDTLAEYFMGNRSLFKDLAIDTLQPEEWESYPVIRFNMSGKAYMKDDDLRLHIKSQLNELEIKYSYKSEETENEARFSDLITKISTISSKKIVILIDEYNTPLSSAIDNKELQEKYREELHGFYSVLKNREDAIQFCMLTGVTRYGKVSVFSGLNNLNDITFDNEFAGICGITTEELHQYYDEGVENFTQELNTDKEDIYKKLKFHYNGYHFSSSLLDIYNPFSINYAFAKRKFQDYWCRSGVPTILSKSLMENDYDVEKLNGKKVPESAITDLSMFTADPIPLFYQTGYLTIKAYEERRRRYTLGYPNREVEAAILSNILKVYTHTNDDRQASIYDMEDALEEGNPKEFIRILSSFLADIPNQLHKYVDRYENYYHTIFYCLTKLIGLDVSAEYSTSEGFIDMLIKTEEYIYIIELKLNGTAEEAVTQIEEKDYTAPFAADPRHLYKIGIGFSQKTHSISSSVIV